ncbi:MAG: motif domain protein [Bryobacterales bacterium]|nr:motif domain protein [Bryobacterales bacterium]
MVEADPDFGGGYVLLGNGHAAAGDLEKAASSFWEALARMPCDHTAYLVLSDILRRRDENDPLCQHLTALRLWKLALSSEIPDHVAGYFSERMDDPHSDFTDPAIFEVLARALDEKSTREAVPDRLLPYQLLNDLQRQAAERMDDTLLRDMLSHSGRMVPIWRAVLRKWTQSKPAPATEEAGLALALLGETAGIETLDELLEFGDAGNRTIFLHANWAIWRMGQRFPEEALARFVTAGAPERLALRCALAEHISLLPETPGIESSLIGLLDGFARLASDPEAYYLLATVMAALSTRGCNHEAERVFAEFSGLLTKRDREWIRGRSNEVWVSELVDEEIPEMTLQEICSYAVFMEDEPDEDDEEWDDEEIVAPIVAPVRPGRNDACWCGSGKKHKKCHLDADEEADRSSRSRTAKAPLAEPMHAKLYRELIDCAKDWRSAADLTEATLRYFGQRPDALESEANETLLGGFVEWYIHDFRPSRTGRTSTEEYLRRRSGILTAPDRESLEAFRQARFGVWEVQRVEEGRGVELKDIFAGDTFFVHDVSCSLSVVRWDCMVCRIYRFQGRWYVFGTGLSVPRQELTPLIQQVERESQESGESAAAYVRDNSHRWHRVIRELYEERLAGLCLVNAEGDELEFCAAVYRIEDETALAAALEAAEAFEAESDDGGPRSFAWLEPATSGARRSYGRIELRDGKLRLECNSRQRLSAGRELVEKHGRAWLRHLGDSFQSQAAMKREAMQQKPQRNPSPASGLPPQVEREILNRVKREHYARWVDENLPALDGRTPREAAQSQTGRRALEDLLRTMENNEEHARREGSASFDFSAVRNQLGM